MSAVAISIALEYINWRDNLIERHKGAGRTLLGSASEVNKMEFINGCNDFARRFSKHCPLWWTQADYKRFAELSATRMASNLTTIGERPLETLTPTEREACKELALTYVNLIDAIAALERNK